VRLWGLSTPPVFAPDALSLAPLAVSISLFLVPFGLIVDEHNILASLFSYGFLLKHLVVLEKMHIVVFSIKLALHCRELLNGLSLHEVVLLAQDLSPGGNLLRCIELN